MLDAELVFKEALTGGDFATAFRADLSDGRTIFVKTHADPPEHFFSTEASGLQWLHNTGTVRIPKVLAVSDEPPFLAMQWIEPGNSNDDADLGRALAELHRQQWPQFGRPDSRTTGSLAVPNMPCDTWHEFYAQRRLYPLAETARGKKALSGKDCRAIEQIADQLSALLIANDKPSLLHGDLWAGNRITDSKGCSWLIDPAAHGGHREFDLAMMQLFGGYSAQCFAAYNDTYPLTAGFAGRVALHQLAPLVVHAIKFGSGYVSAVKDAIEKSRACLGV